jgi:lipoate-protein ligase A
VDALSCRLLPYAEADGPANMAADEAMLESAAGGVASIRFYGWSEPTLSLGYFQPEQLRRRDDALARLPYVRRPTGGATLVHHRELTYALALPAGPPWQAARAPASSWLLRMHAVIATALRAFGVEAATASGQQPAAADVLCFQQHTAGDLLVGTAKVVGSAQRRHRGALLQHGAILLAGSPHTPCLPGIGDLTGRRPAKPELAAVVAEAFTRRTGWALARGDWTPAEIRRRAVLAGAKYSQWSWNGKR